MNDVETNNLLPVVAYVVGAFAGVFYPYLRAWLTDGVAFDWRKAAGKAVAAVLGLLLMPSIAATLEALGGVGWLVAFGMGLAATTIGHEAQRTPAAIEAKRNE